MIKSILDQANFKNTIPFNNQPQPVQNYLQVLNSKRINNSIQQQQQDQEEQEQNNLYFKQEQLKHNVKEILDKDNNKDKNKSIKKKEKK